MASFYNWRVTPFTWHKVNQYYCIDNDFLVQFDDKVHCYTIKFKKGLMTDGGSIPKLFSWFAKGWSNDYRYNATFICHDWCYGSEMIHKDMADDILRSSLRDCGLDRLHASTICWAVKNFADSHYGIMNDCLDIREYGEIVGITPLHA